MNIPVLPINNQWERKYEPDWKPGNKFWLIAIALMILILTFLITWAQATDVDLNIIAQIESSNNPLAYNKSSGARGLYQFLPIAWEDVQQHYPELKKYSYFPYVYNPEISTIFAEKYFLILEKYLKHYKRPVTIINILWSYNMGIKNVIKGKMAQETKDYIRKYNSLSEKIPI